MKPVAMSRPEYSFFLAWFSLRDFYVRFLMRLGCTMVFQVASLGSILWKSSWSSIFFFILFLSAIGLSPFCILRLCNFFSLINNIWPLGLVESLVEDQLLVGKPLLLQVRVNVVETRCIPNPISFHLKKKKKEKKKR